MGTKTRNTERIVVMVIKMLWFFTDDVKFLYFDNSSHISIKITSLAAMSKFRFQIS